MNETNAVQVESDNDTRIADSSYVCCRSTREINGSERSAAENESVTTPRACEGAHDLVGVIDPLHHCVQGAWEIHGSETVSTEQEAVVCNAIYVIRSNDVAA